MKRPFLAFRLNFFVPGLGLWYLGKSLWGVVNFVLVIGGLVVLAASRNEIPPFYMTLATIILLTGSGTLAQVLCTLENRRLQEQKGVQTRG